MTKGFDLDLPEVLYWYFEQKLTLKETAQRCCCSAGKITDTLVNAGYKLRQSGTSWDEKAALKTKVVGFSEKELKRFEEVKKYLTNGQHRQFEMIASYDFKAAMEYFKIVRRNYAISV